MFATEHNNTTTNNKAKMTTTITTVNTTTLYDPKLCRPPTVTSQIAKNVVLVIEKHDGRSSYTIYDIEKIPDDIYCRMGAECDEKCWEEILYHQIRADKYAMLRTAATMAEARIGTWGSMPVLIPDNCIVKTIYEYSEPPYFHKLPQVFQLELTKNNEVVSVDFFLIARPASGCVDALPSNIKCLPQEVLDRFVNAQSGSSFLAAKAGSSILKLEIMEETTKALEAAKIPHGWNGGELYYSLKRTYFDPSN